MSRPRKKRSIVYMVSIGAHLVAGVALALIPQDKLREVVAIAFADAPKPKPAAPKMEAPPRTNPPARAARQQLGARVAPAAVASDGPAESGTSGFTSLGISLDASSLDGVAVPLTSAVVTAPVLASVSRPQPRLLVARKRECEEPIVKARPERLVRPAYTPDARSAQVEGRVRLELTVDEYGVVTDARILSGLGHGLDEQALQAARRMSFKPASRCGKAVSAPFVLSMRFVLGT
jgi:protein TonB